MKVAIAHDFIRHGGAEKALEQMHELWPEAPIYTLLAERNPRYAAWDVRASCLQGWLPAARYRWALPLYPRLVDRLRFPAGIDLLVSSSVSWMKSAAAPPGVPHLCYIYRPMMFAYERQEVFLAGYPAPLRPLLRRLAARVRRWDQARAGRPDRYVAISRYIAEQVRRHYRREAAVLYPPVDVAAFAAAGAAAAPGEYLLTAARLESYKRVDLVVEACSRLRLPLKVAGGGPEEARLRAMAGPSVEFLGFVSDPELAKLMAGCRAFVFAAEEDFGIAPVEAMAAGRPVVAYGAGGCLETVLPGVTGLHFAAQSAPALMDALQALERCAFSAPAIRAWAQTFSQDSFRAGLLRLAQELLSGAGRPAAAAAQ